MGGFCSWSKREALLFPELEELVLNLRSPSDWMADIVSDNLGRFSVETSSFQSVEILPGRFRYLLGSFKRNLHRKKKLMYFDPL